MEAPQATKSIAVENSPCNFTDFSGSRVGRMMQFTKKSGALEYLRRQEQAEQAKQIEQVTKAKTHRPMVYGAPTEVTPVQRKIILQLLRVRFPEYVLEEPTNFQRLGTGCFRVLFETSRCENLCSGYHDKPAGYMEICNDGIATLYCNSTDNLGAARVYQNACLNYCMETRLPHSFTRVLFNT